MRNKYIVPIPSVTGSFKKALLLSLVPFTNVSCEFEKKNLRLTPQNFVLRTAPPESLPHRALSSVGLRFGFFGHFPTEGTEVKSASVTQTEPELYDSFIINWFSSCFLCKFRKTTRYQRRYNSAGDPRGAQDLLGSGLTKLLSPLPVFLLDGKTGLLGGLLGVKRG